MRCFLAAGVLLVFLGLSAKAARAQDAPADTVVAPAQRVVYQRAPVPQQAPVSVQRVRRRIARIGGGGSGGGVPPVGVLRIIYPLVVVPPPPPVVIRQVSPLPDAQRGGAADTGAADDGGFDDDGFDTGYGGYYYPYDGVYEDDDLPPLIGLDEERPPVVIFREDEEEEETPPGDTAAMRPPAPPRLTPPPLPEAPPADVPPVTVRRIERALLNEGLFRTTAVRFEFDQTDILPAFYATLDAVAEVLDRYPELRIMVAGHTDAVGPEVYNQRLSMARAQAVVDYLVARGGIDPDRLVARGYGESRPIAPNEDVTGRTLNRRVEFRVLNPEAAVRYLDEREQEGGGEEDLREELREVIREELERMQADTTDGR